MNLEQLQTMSDKELDILSGVTVMGWTELAGRFYREKFNYTESGVLVRNVAEWNPATDMNDAMELLNSFFMWDIKRQDKLVYTVIIKDIPDPFKDTIAHNKSLPRAITIASIFSFE